MSEVLIHSLPTPHGNGRGTARIGPTATDGHCTSSGSLASAGNVLKVLRMFEDQPTLTVSEVGRVLGVGKSTAHRLLCTLVGEGFVTRDPVHRRYYAGPVLMDIGLAATGALDVRQRAQVPMDRLATHTGTTAMLLALQGQHTRCVHVAEPATSLRVTGRTGDLLPAHATAAGKLLLCGDDEETLRRRFPQGLPRVTKQTITDWDALLVELQAVRERGWATDYEESEPGVHGIALGVRGLTQRTVVALALSAPSSRMPQGRHHQLDLIHHMRTALDAMSGERSRLGSDVGATSESPAPGVRSRRGSVDLVSRRR